MDDEGMAKAEARAEDLRMEILLARREMRSMLATFNQTLELEYWRGATHGVSVTLLIFATFYVYQLN